jgi:hypothetical protein
MGLEYHCAGSDVSSFHSEANSNPEVGVAVGVAKGRMPPVSIPRVASAGARLVPQPHFLPPDSS